MEAEEVAMKPLSKEKSQQIIAVEQKLKYHTFNLKTYIFKNSKPHATQTF